MGNESARISKDEYYLSIAEAVAKRSTCLRRQYGAVIVNNDEIVGTGYNGSPRGMVNCCDDEECFREKLKIPKGERYELCRAVHAEQNAMISCSRSKMIGSSIYIVGLERKDGKIVYADPKPCRLCAAMIKNAGIAHVYGRKPYNYKIDVSEEIIEYNIADVITAYNIEAYNEAFGSNKVSDRTGGGSETDFNKELCKPSKSN